jgi:hypothetical protein
VPWNAVVLWCGVIGGAAGAAGLLTGRMHMTQAGQVLADVAIAVLCAGLLAVRAARAEAGGAHSAVVQAKIRAGVNAAIERGEIQPEGEFRPRRYPLPPGPGEEYLDGPGYAYPEQRARGSRPVRGGRRRTDPPARRTPREGPHDGR